MASALTLKEKAAKLGATDVYEDITRRAVEVTEFIASNVEGDIPPASLDRLRVLTMNVFGYLTLPRIQRLNEAFDIMGEQGSNYRQAVQKSVEYPGNCSHLELVHEIRLVAHWHQEEIFNERGRIPELAQSIYRLATHDLALKFKPGGWNDLVVYLSQHMLALIDEPAERYKLQEAALNDGDNCAVFDIVAGNDLTNDNVMAM